jgi:hypothetical protein
MRLAGLSWTRLACSLNVWYITDTSVLQEVRIAPALIFFLIFFRSPGGTWGGRRRKSGLPL